MVQKCFAGTGGTITGICDFRLTENREVALNNWSSPGGRKRKKSGDETCLERELYQPGNVFRA